MLFGNTVEFSQMTFRLIPKVLVSVDVAMLIGKEIQMIDVKVLEF